MSGFGSANGHSLYYAAAVTNMFGILQGSHLKYASLRTISFVVELQYYIMANSVEIFTFSEEAIAIYIQLVLHVPVLDKALISRSMVFALNTKMYSGKAVGFLTVWSGI